MEHVFLHIRSAEKMVCSVFAGFVERVFLRIGQQRQMVCCVFAGLVERAFLRIGSAEADGLLFVCRSCGACVSAYWVSRDR